MKFLIDVKTFLRADNAMLDLLLPHVSCGYPVKGHWAVWLIPTNKVPEEIKTWLQQMLQCGLDVLKIQLRNRRKPIKF